MIDQHPAGGRFEEEIDLSFHHLSGGKTCLDGDLGLRCDWPALLNPLLQGRDLSQDLIGIERFLALPCRQNPD